MYRTPRTTDNAHDATIPGAQSDDIAFDQVAKRLYIVDSTTETVRFYDDPIATGFTSDGTFQLTNHIGVQARLTARDGVFWGGSKDLAMFVSPATGAMPVRSFSSSRTTGLALDNVGSLYQTETTNNVVRVFLVQRRPVASNVVVAPAAPNTTQNLTLTYAYADPDNQAQTGSTIRWYANDILQPAYNQQATVPASATSKGEVWKAIVQPHDTVEFGAAVTSNVVTIINSAPSATAQAISPMSPVKGSALTASWTYADPDGDSQGPTQLRWFRDNVQQVSLDNATTVPGSLTSKGQVWRVSISPHDGSALGAAVEAQTVIQNSAPVASSLNISPASPASSASLDATWVYSDVDGDVQAGTTLNWYRNGVLQAALSNQTHVNGPLVLGDEWHFTVTPRDGVSFGSAVTSAHVIVGSTAPTAGNPMIAPAAPLRGTAQLSSTYAYLDPDSQPEGPSVVRWYKNGTLTATSSSVSGPFTRGDRWYFTVTPCDSTPLCGPMQTSPTVTVGNTLPVASMATVTPASPSVTNALIATYTFSDGDSDTEAGSDLRWFRNGLEQTNFRNVKQLPAGSAKKTELWHFSIRPSDSIDYGTTVVAAAVTVANSLPTATQLALTPALPTVRDTLVSSYAYSDADGDPTVGTVVRWFKNSVEDASLQNAIAVPPSKLRKGDQWRFTVTPSDGTGTGTVVSSSTVTIQNSAPTASNVTVTPSSPAVGDPLVLNYAWSDVDVSDTESGTTIRWFKNGVEVPAYENLKTVPGSATTRGEAWSATVTPSDGAAAGTTVTSAPVVIGNHVPSASLASITPQKPTRLDVLQATYTFEDADGDLEAGSAIEWFRNGIAVPALNDLPAVPARTAAKKEIWHYVVRPKDGTDFGPPELSRPAIIANSPPAAIAGAPLTFNPTGVLTRVTVDGSGSTDADGDVLTYTWAEGSTQLGQGASASFDLAIGLHQLTLTVSDGDASSTDTTYVTVGDAPPVATVDAGFEAAPGRVQLEGSATDPLNRPISYAWRQVDGPPVLMLDDVDSATASFFALSAASRTFELSATAGSSVSPPAQLEVRTRNVPPWAEAPPKQVVAVGVPFTVDGRWSDDSNADPLSFSWSGTGLSIVDASAPRASVTATQEGVLSLELVVNDGTLSSTTQVTELIAIDFSKPHVPVANAGPDVVTDLGSTITLDGRASYDADADTLRFVWKQVSGPSAQLAFETKRLAQARPSEAGTYVFSLTVSDATSSSRDEVIVTVGDTTNNQRPRIRTSSEVHGVVATSVTLDASQSLDPDGDALQYHWAQLSGPAVTLLNADSAVASFVALRPGVITFEVSAWDGKLNASNRVDVRITSALNHVPAADAGADQTVIAGAVVTLDGSGSSDEDHDPLRFTWVQLEGPPVVLEGPAEAPHFTPAAQRAQYRFALTVWDAEVRSLSDDVVVNVSVHGEANARPVAVVTAPSDGLLGAPIQLDGSKSHDDDATDVLTYEWEVIGYPTTGPIALSETTAPVTSFTPTVEGSYVFRLTVSDGELASDAVTVTVLIGKWPGSGCSCDQTSGVLLPLVLFWWRRRSRPSRPSRT